MILKDFSFSKIKQQIRWNFHFSSQCNSTGSMWRVYNCVDDTWSKSRLKWNLIKRRCLLFFIILFMWGESRRLVSAGVAGSYCFIGCSKQYSPKWICFRQQITWIHHVFKSDFYDSNVTPVGCTIKFDSSMHFVYRQKSVFVLFFCSRGDRKKNESLSLFFKFLFDRLTISQWYTSILLHHFFTQDKALVQTAMKTAINVQKEESAKKKTTTMTTTEEQ